VKDPVLRRKTFHRRPARVSAEVSSILIRGGCAPPAPPQVARKDEPISREGTKPEARSPTRALRGGALPSSAMKSVDALILSKSTTRTEEIVPSIKPEGDARASDTDDPVRYSIIVPTFARRDLLIQGLHALARLRAPWPIEVVVVVDGSLDGSEQAAHELPMPHDKVVLYQENAGAAAARNRGAAAARGRILLFLDDDMEADEHLLEEHERCYEEGADAVVGHMPLHPDSPRSLTALGVSRWERQRLGRLRRQPQPELQDLLTGQLSVRAEVFRAAGGFDERFNEGGRFGGEDTDFLHRLLKSGAAIRAAPDAISRQRYVVTPEQNLRQWYEAGRGDVILTSKHPELARHVESLHHISGVRGAVLGLLARLDGATAAAIETWIVQKAARGSTGPIIRLAFSTIRDVKYRAGRSAALGSPGATHTCSVLAYHAIDDISDPLVGSYAVTAAELEAHLEALLAHGWHFIALAEFLRTLHEGAPPKTVLLTFDDGYRNVLENAAPVLERLGIPAVVFAVTGRTGSINSWDVRRGSTALPLMTAAELRALERQGFSIESHTRTHAPLGSMNAWGVRSEVHGASDDLAALGFSRPVALAYPHGEHSLLARRAVHRAGHLVAFGLDVGAHASRRYAYPRLEVRRGTSPAELLARLRTTSGRPKRGQLRVEARALVNALVPRRRRRSEQGGASSVGATASS
jgi:peptidoglycan/xylan/chitin deacetylase (PgdA/CDA1 family)/GT2 family glycosyltransferase